MVVEVSIIFLDILIIRVHFEQSDCLVLTTGFENFSLENFLFEVNNKFKLNKKLNFKCRLISKFSIFLLQDILKNFSSELLEVRLG